MDKSTLSRIISIVLTAIVALAAIFGYDIAVVQPQLADLQAQIAAAPPATVATRGLTHYSELQADTITATTDLISEGDATVAGAIAGGSINSSGAITATTGNFSGSVTAAGVTSSGSITATGGLAAATLSVSDEVGAGIVLDSPYGQITIGDSQGMNTGGYLMLDGSNDPTVVYVRNMAFQPQKLTVTAKTASYSVDFLSDMGAWFTNSGTGGAITLTLPSAAAGYNVCFYVATAQTLYIDPAGSNQILGLTNATGDRISHGTVGGAACLLALNSSQWAVTLVNGTWVDAN